MFAPQSHHIHRTFGGAPGTSRRLRAGDKENAGALPSKTPVRLGLGKPGGPSTLGRALGAKTVDRNMNQAPDEKPGDDIKPKRLFQTSSKPPAPRAKTPGPRHALRTPAPAPRRAEPSPAPLPSAQRTRRRSRSSLEHAHNHNHSLQSPPKWEEEVSLDSILEADVEPEPQQQHEYDGADELALPTAVDPPYVPEWAGELPDPVATMQIIGQMRPLIVHADPPPPPPFDDVDVPHITLCDDDELEDPLFRLPKTKAVKAKVGPGAGKIPGRGVTRPGTATAARPATATSRPTTATAMRPATAAATTRPPRITIRAPAPAQQTSRPPVPRAPSASSARPTPTPKPGQMRPPSATSRPTSAASRPPSAAPRPTTASSLRPPALAPRPRSTPPGMTSTRRGPVPPLPVPAPIDLDYPELDLDLDALAEAPCPEASSHQTHTTAPSPRIVQDDVVAGPVPDSLTHPAATPSSPTNAADSLPCSPAPKPVAVPATPGGLADAMANLLIRDE